jgi:hypothetical protein
MLTSTLSKENTMIVDMNKGTVMHYSRWSFEFQDAAEFEKWKLNKEIYFEADFSDADEAFDYDDDDEEFPISVEDFFTDPCELMIAPRKVVVHDDEDDLQVYIDVDGDYPVDEYDDEDTIAHVSVRAAVYIEDVGFVKGATLREDDFSTWSMRIGGPADCARVYPTIDGVECESYEYEEYRDKTEMQMYK